MAPVEAKRRRRARWRAALLALGVAAGATPPPAVTQPAGPPGVAIRVVSASDSAPVVGAELRRADGRPLGRTDAAGRLRIAVARGDALRVRAMGFRERVVVAPAAGGDNVLEVALEPLPTMLDAFVTTAGQRVIRASESPRSVTILDRAAIDAAAAVSANQLLRQVPGLQELPSPPARTSISIRGFDDARVLVLVDGEPVAGGLMDSRDIGRLSTLAAERIEVTKGPSAVEFGSDAIGGVINLVQAAPTRRFTLDAVSRVGALGRQEGTLGVSNTVGRVGVRLNGGWRQLDQVMGVNASGSTFHRVYDARADVRAAVTDRLALRLDLQATRERQRWPLDGLFNGFIDNVGGQGFVEATYRGLGGQWRARHFRQRFAYQFRQSRGLLPIAGSADSLEQRERLGRTLVAYTAVAGRHTLDAGVQLSDRAMVAPTKVAGDSVRDHVHELFVRDAVTLGRALVTVGARHTASSLWGSSTNPSLGAVVTVSPALTVRANVARGFRAPGFKDIRYTFLNAPAGYRIVGNPDLDPESSWSRSVGGRWSPSPRFGLDAEWYRNDVDDLIDTRFQGNDAGGLQQFANVNVARARTEGVELSLRARVLGADLSAGYDRLRARDLETGVPLGRRATHTARLHVGRAWAVRAGLVTDLTARYTGRAPVVGAGAAIPSGDVGADAPTIVGEQGALLSVDVQLRQALTRTTELSVGVNNLLDQRPAFWSPALARQLFGGGRVRMGRE
jgi:outer membrane receptor for ferrienterochelin and colicins